MATTDSCLRYVTRFECIGDLCEDTCCVGMHVLLSSDEKARVKQALATRPDLGRDFEKNVEPIEPPLLGYSLQLAKDENDACRFLSSGWCSLQKACGPQALPHTCARFPREVHLREGRREVFGTLACPEMARLCLLSEDGLDSVEGPCDLPARTRPERLDAARYRALGRHLLSTHDRPLSQRYRQLLEQIEGFEPDTPLSPERGLDTVLSVLVGLRARENRRYNAFNETVMLEYQLAALEEDPRLGMLAGPALAERMGKVYQQKKARVDSALGQALEPLVSRYAVNRWLQLVFEAGKPALWPAFDALLQATCVRFLLVGHPVLQRLADEAEWTSSHLELLQRAVVQTVQWFSKYVERDHALWDEVRQHLQGEPGLSRHALTLLELC